MSLIKKFSLFLVVILFGLNIVSCGNLQEDISTLVYGSSDYTSINPIMNEHCEIKDLLFNGLMARDGDGNLIPSLAKSYSYDEDALTYTFLLRDNVLWHDGEQFTADDVKFTIEAIMNPDNGSENLPNYEEISEINIINDYEISFVLSEPNVAFLNYMTMSILPEHLLNGEDMWESEYFRNPVGTGPYKLDRWDVGQNIIMVKNDEYFLSVPKIERVIFKIVNDDSVKAMQLKTGELDLAQITPKDAGGFNANENFVVYDMKTSDYRGILYNFRNEFWQENADLIPAINYAIDRQAILDSVLLGKGDVAYSPLQRNIYNNENVERYDYNPEKAIEVLTSLGLKKDDDGFWSRNGERITFVINATPGDNVRIDMARIAAQQLREIGLDVKANVPAGGIDWGNQECCIIGWGSPFDADDHTYKVFGTDKGANYSGYSNELVDKYLSEARKTTDTDARMRAYSDFQLELAKTPAYTFFCYIDALYVADKKLQGIDTDTILGHHGVGIFHNICEWEIVD